MLTDGSRPHARARVPEAARVVGPLRGALGPHHARGRLVRVFALWKLIVFMEGNYRRALAGSTDDPHLTRFGTGIAGLADHALEITREQAIRS